MTSFGKLTYAAPGRPDSAARNALATTSLTESEATTDALNLVTGLQIDTASIVWCSCFSVSAVATAPPNATTGSPSEFTVAKPVTRFETPRFSEEMAFSLPKYCQKTPEK
jgi:hypothetical protein